MKRKKSPNNSYRFPWEVAFVGWLIAISGMGGLGIYQQIEFFQLLKSLVFLTISWYISMFIYSLLLWHISKK